MKVELQRKGRVFLAICMAFSPMPLAVAQSEQPSATEAAGKQENEREKALDDLLSERDSEKAFDAAVEAARKAGVSEQAILEARFLYHVDLREDEKIAAMLPEFLKQCKHFKLEESAVFATKEDWLAVVEYVQAIVALEAGNKAAFKTHITEAFWLSPRQAAAFTQQIERMRLEELMSDVKVNFAIHLKNLSGEATTLAKLSEGKKAILLHFWSPQSQECEANLPDFATTASALDSHGIAVVSLLPDRSEELQAEAKKMIQAKAEKAPATWVLDRKKKSLATKLRIQDLPTMVLLSPDGKVLYNGDPTDHEFWDALKKVSPDLERPASKDGDKEAPKEEK